MELAVEDGDPFLPKLKKKIQYLTIIDSHLKPQPSSSLFLPPLIMRGKKDVILTVE